MASHPRFDAQENGNGDSSSSSTILPDVHAANVYVLMKKYTRVSRNIRACWFFKHLRKSIEFTPLTSIEDLRDELTLVSVIPHDAEVELEHGHTYRVHIGPDTIITFLSWQYRLSFTLDLSPSVMSVDAHNGEVVYDGIFQSLSRCLRGLVMPFLIPGSDIWFSPDLYISVICQTPVICSATNQVLVQGVKLGQENIDFYLKLIKSELSQFEAALSVSFDTLLKLHRKKENFFIEEEEEADNRFNLSDHMGNPEAGFTNMLRYGILSLQLLPDYSSSGIIVITDGNVGLPSSAYMELLLNQLRAHSIMCSFIKVGSPSGLYRRLAHVPHIELMQAIATATFGAYLGSGPDESEEKSESNLYHRAMLFWTFQRGLEGFKYELTHHSDEDMPGSISWIKKLLYRHPITNDSFGVEDLRKEREKRTVSAGLHSVLSVRLREGYTIKSVCFKKDNTEIHVKLHFPWRDYGKIEYAAWSAWPLESSNPVTHIEVAVEGSYDLLHEMLCKPTEKKSNLRMNNIKTLWTILEKISSTDQMLEHIQSFSSKSVYHQTPESIRSGVPLFYIQQEGPLINMQLKASTMEKFAAFWKAVIQLDTNNWQKWLHVHRIGLVLEHDRQFPKCFQVPNASSRFSSIQCRQALASLSLLLREWSTFVLAENHSYIKFLLQEQDKPPRYFCVLRLTSKAPSVIIRLGFLGGTPASIRDEQLKILREKMENLRFPPRGMQKSPKKPAAGSKLDGVEVKKKPHKSPLNREGSEIACCVLLRKPVEKILVIYESKPNDMATLKEPVREMSPWQPQDPMKSVFRTLTHYLQHQRWVWNIQANSKAAVPMSSISRMLATLTKMRLQEGFHFAVSGSGVTNLVLEIDMKESEKSDEQDTINVHSCVVQYIVFPPHTKTVDDSLSEDDQEGVDTAEADMEVQVVTECWLEPQYGVCCNNTPERQHFNGLDYLEVAKVFFPIDFECVSSLTTFEHLVYLCQNSGSPSPDAVASRQSSPPSTPGHHIHGKKEECFRSEPTINFISFPFDLQSILPRSQQAELLFSTYVIKDGNRVSQDVVLDPNEPNELLLSLFLDKLKEGHNNEILISADDCLRFVQQVLRRSRDCETHPVPFGYRPDCPTDISRGENTQADSTPASDCGTPSYSGHSSTPSFKRSGSVHCPMWKCYVKMDEEEHLLLTFAPASFEDLLLLNPSLAGDAAAAPDQTVPDPGAAVSASEQLPVLQDAKVSRVGDPERKPAKAHRDVLSDSSQVKPLSLHVTGIVSSDNAAQTGSSANRMACASPDRETKYEKVQEWVNTSTHSMNSAVTGPLLIPVYVYSCELKNITTSLIDRWTFSLPPDIFEDMSFKSDSTSDQKSPRSPRTRLQSFSKNLEDREELDTWRYPHDRRSTDSNSFRVDSFKEHGKIITELFFNSFVMGVFLNLQQSYFVDSQDVDAAINNICEESHPLEMDMTTFLLSSCSHLQHLVHRACFREREGLCRGAKSGQGTRRHLKRQSVHFQDLYQAKEYEGSKLPESLQLPSQSVDISETDWANMTRDLCQQFKECEQLTEMVQAKFMSVLRKCLRPVPSLPDFYFYYSSQRHMNSENETGTDHLNDSEESDRYKEDAVEADRIVEEDEDMAMSGNRNVDLSVGTSMDFNHDESSLNSFDGNIFNTLVERDPLPLFVHFTCTVKQKSNCQHTSVRTVPQCLGQITQGFTESLKCIDFSDFKVTFDIICLTLGDFEQPAMRKPSYLRLLSSTSRTSEDLSQHADRDVHSPAMIDNLKPLGDPISHLPRMQHSAVYCFKEEIEALMQEEVVSALRHMYPITADTLTFVADHIRTTVRTQCKTVLYQCINLQFVYGANQSLNIFIEEFERQKLAGYRLTKEGNYYFLIVDKTLAHQLRFAQQLKSAVTCLDIGHQERNRPVGGAEEEERKMSSERSFSLPCIFSSPSEAAGGIVLPSGTQSMVNTSGENASLELAIPRLRPRSFSDTKHLRRPCSTLARTSADVKVTTTLPEVRQYQQAVLNRIENLRTKDTGDADQSLKKSSSYAGLQGDHVRNSTVRLRHRSAPTSHVSNTSRPSTMPQSPSVISSRESTTDDGFDGDVSDMELDETASMSDISSCHPELPEFWLLLQIHPDKTEVFFHSRETVEEDSPASMQHNALFADVKCKIQQVCRKVNQALLLKELNKTKSCNSLLVPEADEDVSWTSRRTLSGRSVPYGYENNEEDDSEEGQNQGYLATSMDYGPGFFACNVVWRHFFTLHPRLKCVTRGGAPMGVMVLRGVLTNFLVTNRKNMFVIEELTSKNVFYLRLKEIQVSPEITEFDLEASLSDSSHFTQLKTEMPKVDSDTVSLTSSLGRQSSRVEDVVELTVHGVEEAGKEIKDDLMKMLQNKLDEALLDTICLMLSRNPQCKLKADDIYFIQKPRQEPVETLQLTIPGHCSMYLVALMYYLRQNLLQVLHTPNYVDTNPANQFQDLIGGVWSAIPSDKVYLYNRPQQDGGKGIACVCVSLVDGQGKEVKLLNCPCPTKNYNPALTDPSEFEKLVMTHRHERSTSSRPGPTALIQFRIWECGNCDWKVLQDRLTAAVKHALCDIVMEYFVLTSPICSVPRSRMDMGAAPVSSLPASPVKMPAESQDRKHNTLIRKMSVDPPRSVTNSSTMFTSYMDFRQSSSDTAEKCLDFSTVPLAPDQHSLPRTPGLSVNKAPASAPSVISVSEAELVQQTILKYESGEEGCLHPIFCSLIQPWMSFCHSMGVPSVTKTKFQFLSKFSIDFVMKELLQSVPTISTDTVLRMFKVIHTRSPGYPPYGVRYTPCKTTVQDVQMAKMTESVACGQGQLSLMGVGRNIDQWLTTVQYNPDVIPVFSASTLKGYRNAQRFLPQVPSGDVKQSDPWDLRLADKDFVPRQKILIIVCEKKEMTMLMYNWSYDQMNQMEKTVTRLIQWNNARSHILDSIIAQKMGIFHHFAFSDLQYTMSQNPYTQSSAEVDSLIRYHAPSRDYQRRHSSLSGRERDRPFSRSIKSMIPFDQTYKNLPPPRLLQKLVCSSCSDPVLRHGMQTQDSRMHTRQEKVPLPPPSPQQQPLQQLPSQAEQSGIVTRKEACNEEKVPLISIRDPVFQHGLQINETQKYLLEEEERTKLYQLYLEWSVPNWKTHDSPPITEDYLIQLKRAGRLFHYCATPLVFSASWRQNVVQKITAKKDKWRVDMAYTSTGTPSSSTATSTTATAGASTTLPSSTATTPATPDKGQKTRSRHSSGTSNVSIKGKVVEEVSRRSSDGGGGGGLGRNKLKGEEEELWHFELRKRFIKEYKQYLMSKLGFITLNVQPVMNRRSQGSSVSSQGSVDMPDGKNMTVNLQKTLTGGIIVMELSFRQEFFCVKMFAVDCSQLRVIVNQEIHLIFVDECDKYKDLIHVHSFAHDFHLRTVQHYLDRTGENSVLFPERYDVDSFLTDFKLIHQYPPSFSRNCLYQDSVVLSELPFPGEMLYTYMLKQMGSKDMRVLRMGEKFALVQQSELRLSGPLAREGDEDPAQEMDLYNACMVIINNSNLAGTPEEPTKLVLKYFTVLTRQRDCYPIGMLERAFGEFRDALATSGGARPKSSGSTSSVTPVVPVYSNSGESLGEQTRQVVSHPVAVKQHLGMRMEYINYRGYSNLQQLSLYNALKGQSERGRGKILDMVEMSKKKCRRDYLWKRLLTHISEDSELGTDESLDTGLSPLSSAEFCELLEKVIKTPLSEVDSQLSPLSNMPVAWYKGLFTALTTKYPKTHSCFSSIDGHTQYIVVLNANDLDKMFAMLSFNNVTERIELCIVMKEPVLLSASHSPDMPNLPLYSLQTHVEDVVNVCCYHIWASMLR